MLLETRKRSGEWVGTPVNVVVDGDRAFFSTGAKTAKVKRIGNFPEVRVAPCTPRGKPAGAEMNARAQRIDGAEAERAKALLTREYPFVYRVMVPIEMRALKTHPVFYELSGFSKPREEPG
jgi:PPOX class probable F420-dependent enzyme